MRTNTIHEILHTVKFPKYAPGLIFSKALFEGFVCRGAYIQWEMYVTKLIGLAYSWKANKKVCGTIQFLLSSILYLRAISK